MRVALCALMLICFAAISVRAGGDVRDLPPRAAAMGGSGCALGGALLPVLNPASALGCGSGGAVYWTPQRFGFTELGSVNAGWSQQFHSFSASAQLQRFGYDVYNEHRLDVSAAAQYDSCISIGVRMSLHAVSIARYGNGLAAGVDIGTRVLLTEHLYAGALAEQVLQQGFTDSERLPLVLRLGAGWERDGLQLAMDIEARMRSAPCLRVGAEYAVHRAVCLRLGMSHDPHTVTAGCGFHLAGFSIDYAVAVHPDLGWTHTAGIGFQP